MALIEEARSKIRVIRSKLIHREDIRELDNNNRLLAIGQLLLVPISCCFRNYNSWPSNQ